MAEPVVKWVGGKTRLLPELRARMPSTFGTYYEPFAGGAALFFAVEPEHAVLADANDQLINLYRCLASSIGSVLLELEWLAARHSEDLYYSMRRLFNTRGENDPLTATGRAALFIYLNKTCFNGLWRVNRSGEFNTPMGDYKNPTICNAPALRAAGDVLAHATLRANDYRTVVDAACRGDFLYFDPPYVPLTPTSSFTSYTAGVFGPAQQCELSATARALVARGCQVMLSNSDTPFVRELYRDFRIDQVKCGRSINSDPTKRGAVDELIITGGYDF